MYNKIVILTGAGISQESGINTFRADNGLWEQHKIEDVATPEGYQSNPELVNNFYNQRIDKLNHPSVQPNAAHLAIAKLAEQFNGELFVVTQNVDDLHERAGLSGVHHMHGELLKGRCVGSGQVFKSSEPFSADNLCSCCIPSQAIRPHIVWFGEMPLGMDKIHHQLEQCDLFIAIGTSGSVYPAADFVNVANSVGATTLEINLEQTCASSAFMLKKRGRASEVVPQVVNEILSGMAMF